MITEWTEKKRQYRITKEDFCKKLGLMGDPVSMADDATSITIITSEKQRG